MSTVYPLPDAAEQIAAGLTGWFTQEHGQQAFGATKQLNDLTESRAGLMQPIMESTNGRKMSGHTDRIEHAGQMLIENPTSDQAMAFGLLSIFRLAAGYFSHQCTVEAVDQEDYRLRKYAHGPLGLDIGQLVTKNLTAMSKNTIVLDEYQLSAETLSEAAITRSRECFNGLAENVYNGKSQFDLGKPMSLTARRLMHYQERLMNVGIWQLMHAAAQRDSLEAVPLLEAKSISKNPGIYYPFAK